MKIDRYCNTYWLVEIVGTLVVTSIQSIRPFCPFPYCCASFSFGSLAGSSAELSVSGPWAHVKFDPNSILLLCWKVINLRIAKRSEGVAFVAFALEWKMFRALPVLCQCPAVFCDIFLHVVILCSLKHFSRLYEFTVSSAYFSFLRGYISVMAASLEESLKKKTW